MSSKKKAGKKKGGKKKKTVEAAPREPDEFDAMDEEALRAAIGRSESQLAELRRNRNFYQLERDQFERYYQSVHGEVEQAEATIRNVESQMEQMQERHRNDIRIYLQKVVHLEYEHENNVKSVQRHSEEHRGGKDKQYEERRKELMRMKAELKALLAEEESQYEKEVQSLKVSQSKEMDKLREQFEISHKELEARYEKRLQELREDLELRRKLEIHEIEERKNKHINELMANHERAFEEMRNYYNSLTQDNLDLIRAFKEELADLHVRADENRRTIEEVKRRNRMLAEPLAQAQERVKTMQEKLVNHEKDRRSLRQAKNRLVVLEDKLKKLTQQHEAMKSSFQALESERDALYESFERTLATTQAKGGVRNEMLAKELSDRQEQFEQRRAQFKHVLQTADLDPVVLHNVTQRLDAVITRKNETIADLRYNVTKLRKAHDDLVRACESKLVSSEVPDEDRDVRPLLGGVTPAPADLLS